MNLVLIFGIETSYLLSALTLAVLFGTVLLVVKLMTILWINDGVLFGNSNPSPLVQIPNVKMMIVNIPFTFKLQENTKSKYEGVHCVTSSEVCYRLEAYWGVSIRDLHFFLRQPWNYSNIMSLKETSFCSHYQHISDIIREESHEAKVIDLKLSSTLHLGTPPRHCYPLVVFLFKNTSEELQPDETVALINIVHISDNICTLPTGLLAQYLKQANGRLTALKQLYIASENPVNHESEFESKENGDPLCVVCQVFPISRALLPCRHTCVCVACFNKIKACPLCRSPIKSYFLIRNEDYFVEPEKKLPYTTNNGTLSQWFQDRVTDFLGFER